MTRDLEIRLPNRVAVPTLPEQPAPIIHRAKSQKSWEHSKLTSRVAKNEPIIFDTKYGNAQLNSKHRVMIYEQHIPLRPACGCSAQAAQLATRTAMQPEACRSRNTKIRDNTIETSGMQSCNGVLQLFPASATVIENSTILVRVSASRERRRTRVLKIVVNLFIITNKKSNTWFKLQNVA